VACSFREWSKLHQSANVEETCPLVLLAVDRAVLPPETMQFIIRRGNNIIHPSRHRSLHIATANIHFR